MEPDDSSIPFKTRSYAFMRTFALSVAVVKAFVHGRVNGWCMAMNC